MQLPRPEHEVARIKVLGRYQIIGSPPEECFDNITRLAAYVCGTPIALISFIDQNCQWFKSKVGWDVDEIRAAMLVAVLAGESPAGGNCSVATVVISGSGASDQAAGSPEVKVSVGWRETFGQLRQGGERVGRL